MCFAECADLREPSSRGDEALASVAQRQERSSTLGSGNHVKSGTMSQPGTLPVPTPGIPTGQQTARLAALDADGEQAIETLPPGSAVPGAGTEKVAVPQPTGPDLPGIDSQPCSYLSLFRSGVSIKGYIVQLAQTS